MGHGFALYAGVAPEIIRATAREAEGLGYSSFWVNHPGSMDGLGALAQAAGDTRRIELGIGVIPLHTRGPESITEGVKRHALPLDRLLLGVGSPNPEALKRVREGIKALRAQLSTRLIVAALGPKMCGLAGEVADGVLLNWLTPEHARASADLVRAGAAAAKRPAPRIFAYVRLAIRGDPGLCRQLRAHGREAGGYGHRGGRPRVSAGRARPLARRGRRGGATRHHRRGHGRREPDPAPRREAVTAIRGAPTQLGEGRTSSAFTTPSWHESFAFSADRAGAGPE